MGVPKYKPSKSRQRLRRTHDALAPLAIIKCQNCGLATKAHSIRDWFGQSCCGNPLAILE